MMNRRTFLCGLTLGTLFAPLPAEAQKTGRVYRIGDIAPDAGPSVLTEAFRQRLRDLGYIEGRNLAIEYRWLGSRPERLPEAAAELVSLRPDLIVAISHRVAMAVKKATTTIPIAFAHVNDPVGVGLVRSLAHPGGNVTGLSAQGLDLIAKRLELLKELLPSESRVAYLGNPDEPYSPVYLLEAQRAALALGMKEVLSVEVRGSSDFAAAFALIAVRRPNALLVEPIIDGNPGLRRAVGLVWLRAAVQRCCVHKLRNLERKAPKHALAEIRDDFHRIVYAANADTARAAYSTFERTWAKRCPGVVTSLREGGDELLTFFRFPKAQ